MIVVDTSALMAIALREDEADRFDRFLFEQDVKMIATPTLFEFNMVAANDRRTRPKIDPGELLLALNLSVQPWDPTHALIAFDAFIKYGKGRHPAKLNFGDCMSYALAKSLDVPLLYKGDDFAKTDIVSAI